MADIYYPAISGNSFMDESILDAYDKTCAMEKGIENSEKAFQEISKRAGGDPCETIVLSNKLTEVVQDVTSVVSNASGTIHVFNGFQNCIAMQVVLKRLQLCLLRAKRLVVKIKLKIAEITKKLLIAMISGKGSSISNPVIEAINAVFMTLGTAINVVLQLIETFMSAVSAGPLGVNPQGMTFFFTPKSMNMTKITVLNPNSAIGDRYPQPVYITLFNIRKAVDVANAAIKKAALVAGAAAGAVSIMSNNPKFGISNKLSRINPGKLQKAVDLAEDLIPIPLGLPRYEKLKFTNLGFLAFLITGFEPAAHKSFGIPGQF